MDLFPPKNRGIITKYCKILYEVDTDTSIYVINIKAMGPEYGWKTFASSILMADIVAVILVLIDTGN